MEKYVVELMNQLEFYAAGACRRPLVEYGRPEKLRPDCHPSSWDTASFASELVVIPGLEIGFALLSDRIDCNRPLGRMDNYRRGRDRIIIEVTCTVTRISL